MEWFTEIDLYCERVGTAFWAEPINAISNLSFVIAALWAASSARKRGQFDISTKVLCLLGACIGLGSFLFHTTANLWSSFADVIPIWSFVALYILVVFLKLTGRQGLTATRLLMFLPLLFISLGWIFISGSATQVSASTDALNGSSQYTPALIGLWVFALISLIKKRPVWPWVMSAAVIFTLSLVARTYDLALCSSFALGSHFLWHLLNGLMIGFLLQALIRIEQTSSLNPQRDEAI